MYWYKVKNVLIILFAVINLFLIGVIVTGRIQTRRQAQELAETLLLVLQSNQIDIDEDIIPDRTPAMSSITVVNMISDDMEFAKSMLGSAAHKQTDDEGRPCYVSGNKTLYIDKGSFYYKDAALEGKAVQTDSDAQNAKAALAQMGFDMSDALHSLEGRHIVFTCYFEKAPIFVTELTLEMSGDIAEAQGYLISLNKNDVYEKHTVRSAMDALADFLQDSSRPRTPLKIEEITLGYSILLGEDGVNFTTAEAVPTYRIVTSDSASYYYDARPN